MSFETILYGPFTSFFLYVAKVQLGRSQLISGWSGGWMVQVVVPLKWCFSRLCLSPHLTIPCTECKSIIPHHCVFSILIWYIVKVVILMGVHICMTTLCNKVRCVLYMRCKLNNWWFKFHGYMSFFLISL